MPPKRVPIESENEVDGMSEGSIEALKLQLALAERKLQIAQIEKENNEKLWVENERERNFQKEMAGLNIDQRPFTSSQRERKKVSIPRIHDGSDPSDILIAFERICKTEQIPESEYVNELLPFLGDKAMKAYARLDADEATNYQKLKLELLKTFKLTSSEHKKRFRNLKKTREESYVQFAKKLDDAFSGWINGLEVEHTYENLKNLILMEQFENNLGTELKIWISDRDPDDVCQMAELSDKYMESRHHAKFEDFRERKPEFKKNPHVGGINRNLPTRNQESFPRREIKCFTCNTIGHKSYECRRSKFVPKRDSMPNKVFFVGIAKRQHPNRYDQTMILNGKMRTAYRDTGAFKTIIREDLVKPHQLTGDTIRIATITGQEGEIPIARVQIDSEGRSKDVEVATMKDLQVEILLGNDIGNILRPVIECSTGKVDDRTEECGNYLSANGSNAYVQNVIINDKFARTLRDTGTDISVVKSHLVMPKQYQKHKENVKSVSGKEMTLPTARIKIEDQRGIRNLTVAVSDNIPTDFLWGNADGPVMQPIGTYMIITRQKARDNRKAGEHEQRKENYTHENRENPSDMSCNVETEVQRSIEMSERKKSDGRYERNKTDGRLERNKTDGTYERNKTDGRYERNKADVRLERNKVDGKYDRNEANGMYERKEDRLEIEKQMEEGSNDAVETDINVAEILQSIGGREEFIKAQHDDPQLINLFAKVVQQDKSDENATFYEDNGVLMRRWVSRKQGGQIWKQIVAPTKVREALLHTAHKNLLAGHLAVKKTRDRILKHFYWPSIFSNVSRFVESCEQCQRMRRPGGGLKAPLHPIPAIGEPFFRVGLDLIGPLPATSDGNRFILTVTCYATKYPEAVPLSLIEAETVIEELIKIFTRVGFPREIICDQGKQFVADVTKGLWQRTGVKLNTASVYHPQSNGQVENFNGVLKHMLRTLAERYADDWDKLIPFALFAFREVPSQSTGFSPFELLFGRDVRGPLEILKRSWTADVEEKKAVTTYLCDLRNKMAKTARLAVQQINKSQDDQKVWYDRKSRKRKFVTGQLVLVLRPFKVNALDVAWDGPYKIKRKISDLNYELELEDGCAKIYHVNMLKPWKSNAKVVGFIEDKEDNDESDEILHEANTSRDNEELEWRTKINEREIFGIDTFTNTRGWLQFGEELNIDQKEELSRIIEKRKSIFRNQPGCTNVIEHNIELSDNEPVKVKQYRISWNAKLEMRKQIKQMLDWDVIEESTSKYSSPILMVPKSSSEMRFCADMRMLNKKTKFDAFPTPHIEEALAGLRGAKYLSKIDLFRGYWQIPLSERAKEMTAFRADDKLYQFKKMPFGLKNSSATFVRLMQKVLDGSEAYAKCYIDDILIFSDDWNSHVMHIDDILRRLEKAGLTAKIEKCSFAVNSVEFLGFKVGPAGITPCEAKVKAICDWPRPSSKKQIRMFMGVCSYYRKSIRNFAGVAQVLYDQTKKSNKTFEWTKECDEAFNELKLLLTQAPVLVSPKPGDKFVLQIDASDTGLGAILNIAEDGVEKPVLFLSRSLTRCEMNYSTIEKEALGLVWSIEKIRPYVFMTEFLVQTDHNPLTFIHQMRGKNRKILRWSLLLQEYKFKIEYKKGTLNTNADGLSRRY